MSLQNVAHLNLVQIPGSFSVDETGDFLANFSGTRAKEDLLRPSSSTGARAQNRYSLAQRVSQVSRGSSVLAQGYTFDPCAHCRPSPDWLKGLNEAIARIIDQESLC